MSYGQAFNLGAVKYKGKEHVSLNSVKNFYNFHKMSVRGKSILMESRGVRLQLTSGSRRCQMNGLLFILSSPIVFQNGKYLISRIDLLKLVEPVIRPAHILKAKVFNTVVLDPGHGGADSGAVGHLGAEKVYALKVARLVRDMLERRGYRVVMTRDRDIAITRKNRVSIANKYRNAVFISIHFNSARTNASGIETFTVSPVGVPHQGRGVRAGDFRQVPGNAMDSASIALATAVHGRSLLYLNNPQAHNFRIVDRGIKRARFDVLTGIAIPAILFEGGFLSNRTEAVKIHSPVYQQTLAAGIVRAVDIYRSSIARRP